MGFAVFGGKAAGIKTLAEDTLRALSQSQAIIEFEPDGTIIRANDNFLAAVGYQLDEVRAPQHVR